MKKTYIKPTSKVVKLNACNILANSPEISVDPNGEPVNSMDAKETWFYDSEEEGY